MILKCCVDAEWLYSIIDLEFIPDVEIYKNLENAIIRINFDRKAEESKNMVTLETIDWPVKETFHADMKEKDAQSRLKTLITHFETLLQRNRFA